MPDNLRPIDRLEADWRGRGSSPAAVAVLQRLAATEPPVAAVNARDLADLVAWLRSCRAPADAARAAAVVQILLRHGRLDPLIPRTILQAILPGLIGVARRLSWGDGGDWTSRTAFFVDLVTTAWELIVEWSGQDRPYAVLDLLSAARCRMRRQLFANLRDHRQQIVGLDAAALPAEPSRRGLTDLDELARSLDELSAADASQRADAAVLYAHRVLGYSLSDLARLTGRSRRHLAERRDRAARVLTA